eukprot:scaffold4543_cov126-Isochrysis_galbana.AAC.2
MHTHARLAFCGCGLPEYNGQCAASAPASSKTGASMSMPMCTESSQHSQGSHPHGARLCCPLCRQSPVITRRQGQGRRVGPLATGAPSGHVPERRGMALVPQSASTLWLACRNSPYAASATRSRAFLCARISLKPRTATQPPHSMAHTTTRTHTHTAAHGAQASPALVPVRSLLTRATHKPPPPPQTDPRRADLHRLRA